MFNHRVITSDVRFFQGSAVVDGAYVVKFAWSESPARRIVHEGHVLMALADLSDALVIPAVVATSTNPALIVTSYVGGNPFTWQDTVRVAGPAWSRLVEDLAAFLAKLHHQDTFAALRAAGVSLDVPEPQASTSDLRSRFPRLVTSAQARTVEAWCDWVDATLRHPRPKPWSSTAILVDTTWSGTAPAVHCAWWPTSRRPAAGDPAFDFRYLPSHGLTPDFFFEAE